MDSINCLHSTSSLVLSLVLIIIYFSLTFFSCFPFLPIICISLPLLSLFISLFLLLSVHLSLFPYFSIFLYIYFFLYYFPFAFISLSFAFYSSVTPTSIFLSQCLSSVFSINICLHFFLLLILSCSWRVHWARHSTFNSINTVRQRFSSIKVK
jgi:hypothetical protein